MVWLKAEVVVASGVSEVKVVGEEAEALEFHLTSGWSGRVVGVMALAVRRGQQPRRLLPPLSHTVGRISGLREHNATWNGEGF